MGLQVLSEDAFFRDRTDAGERLAVELARRAEANPLILGIPRGGLVVGLCIANRLNAQLDVALARKLRAPEDPELAIGAVMEGGETYLNQDIIAALAVDQAYIEEAKSQELAEIEEHAAAYRVAREFVPRKGRNVIVVDDGVATGATVLAALQGLRAAGPASLWCAVGVGPRSVLDELADVADEVVSVAGPTFFSAVGQFYERFDQVADAEVLRILRQAAKRQACGKQETGRKLR